jgi:hypothetical protein
MAFEFLTSVNRGLVSVASSGIGKALANVKTGKKALKSDKHAMQKKSRKTNRRK